VARHGGSSAPSSRRTVSAGRLLPLAAAAATGVQVGSAMVATRFVVDQTGPASLALLRYAIGVACLAPIVLATRPRVRIARADLLPIALLGTVQFGVLIALLNYGLRFVPSGRAALIFATFPLLTMLTAVALRHERLSAMRSLGVLATIGGVAVALGDKALAPWSGGEWIGELAVLASALCGAVCSVLYRPYLGRYPALPVSAFAMLASVVFLAILAVPEGFFDALPRFTPAGWAAVAFIGVGSGAGYYLWLWALRHASATEVTAFLALSPFTAACLGAWLLGEAMSASAAVGILLVAAGLYLAYRAPRPTNVGRTSGSTSAVRSPASPRP
jgi:drug/metabolite transporter (DMT)-like permease